MEYDMIDRFLRNNLGDDDYAKYSAALDSLCTPQRKPLTDDEFTTAIEVAGIPVEDVELVYAIKDVIEAAHGIKE